MKRRHRPGMGIARQLRGPSRELGSANQAHGAEAVRRKDRERPTSLGRWIGRIIFVALLVLCVGGTPARAVEELDLGMISDSPGKTIKLFTPLCDYLRSKGLRMGKIV